MTVDYKQIGKRVKEIRRLNHMTQAELAELTDMSDNYISRIERGVKKASLGSLIKMAMVFDTSLDALVFGEDVRR